MPSTGPVGQVLGPHPLVSHSGSCAGTHVTHTHWAHGFEMHGRWNGMLYVYNGQVYSFPAILLPCVFEGEHDEVQGHSNMNTMHVLRTLHMCIRNSTTPCRQTTGNRRIKHARQASRSRNKPTMRMHKKQKENHRGKSERAKLFSPLSIYSLLSTRFTHFEPMRPSVKNTKKSLSDHCYCAMVCVSTTLVAIGGEQT